MVIEINDDYIAIESTIIMKYISIELRTVRIFLLLSTNESKNSYLRTTVVS